MFDRSTTACPNLMPPKTLEIIFRDFRKSNKKEKPIMENCWKRVEKEGKTEEAHFYF